MVARSRVVTVRSGVGTFTDRGLSSARALSASPARPAAALGPTSRRADRVGGSPATPRLPRAPRARARTRACAPALTRASAATEPSRHPWSWLLMRVFAADVTTCERAGCGGRMRIAEIATERHDVERVLFDLDLGPRGPPRPRPRAARRDLGPRAARRRPAQPRRRPLIAHAGAPRWRSSVSRETRDAPSSCAGEKATPTASHLLSSAAEATAGTASRHRAATSSSSPPTSRSSRRIYPARRPSWRAEATGPQPSR